MAVSQQNDLEYDARVIGAATDYIVTETAVHCSEVEFVVDRVVQRKKAKLPGSICSLSTTGRRLLWSWVCSKPWL